MLRSRRVRWLTVVAALAGLAAVVTVVVDKLNSDLARQDAAAFLRSLADPPPPGATPDDVVTPDAALVAGTVVTVHGSAVCPGGTRAEVTEDDDAVSVRIQSYHPVRSDTLCIPEGSPTTALVELDRPLGARLLVDAETGEPIPVLPAAYVLRPAYVPPGWQHIRTSVDVDDGVITAVVTTYADQGHIHQLGLRQAMDASEVHTPEGAHSGAVWVNGETAHWMSRPAHDDYHEIAWPQDGYGMTLYGHAEDVSVLIAVARSVE